MDEDSVGIIGVLLIVTVLVMSQTVLPIHRAAAKLPTVRWTDVVSAFGCIQSSDDGCSLIVSQ